jgi:hypothetical protein
VLQTLDGLDESDIEKLLSARPAPGNSTSDTPGLAWVAEAIGADKAASARIGRWITTRSQQYTADILAVSGNGRAFKRARIIVDAREATPTIRYRRDLTDRGWPMDSNVLASIRAGQGPGNFGTGFSGGSY